MVVKPRIALRPQYPSEQAQLEQAGISKLLARLWSSRGIKSPSEINIELDKLINPKQLYGLEQLTEHLAQAIQNNKKLLIIADYDCDGATACAVAMLALKEMGADVGFFVPNRLETGYGLSPEVVELALQHPAGKPDLLITVDNGIASHEGVIAAKAHDIDVIITDHHLPADTLPPALAIINPNQPDCPFPSKHLAGVGVIFYAMIGLRALLRTQNYFTHRPEPKLDGLLDLVALGTVADVVKLDHNNRLLVTQGLKRIRQGLTQPGIQALFSITQKSLSMASATDLGYTIAPRINAAGRLADMSLGIRCLISRDPQEALQLAQQLDAINHDRKNLETTMREQALLELELTNPPENASLCVYHDDWHQGVIGLVASRLKDRFWRPTLAFAPDQADTLKGSGRSIPEVHLRDVLDLVSKRHPEFIKQFGGHAMAAGLTLFKRYYADFIIAFDQAVIELAHTQHFEPVIETDGSLDDEELNIETAMLIEQQVWGAGFPYPVFNDDFYVLSQRLLKDKHLQLTLEKVSSSSPPIRYTALWFNHAELLPERINAAYRLNINTWQGKTQLQLLIDFAS